MPRILRRLRDMLDVDASAIGNGKVPVYRTASGKHEYETVAGGASAASGVSVVDAGGYFTGTDLEAVTQELGADVGSQTTDLANHLADATDAHDASAISFVAGGTIAGTDAQTAIAEVATDAASALSTHEADTTAVHGITDTSTLYRSGGTDVAVADGGTGASTAVAGRNNLGSPSAGLPDAFVAETCPRWNAPGSGSAPTAGNVYVSRITLRAFAYTTASIFQGGTRAVTAANCFLGVYDVSSLALLASSADFAANINAVAANNWVDVPLSYTPGADGDFYMALLIGSAGTMPTVYQGKGSATASAFFSGKNPILADRHTTTGLTSLPATLTLSGTSGTQYFFHRFA